MQGQEHTVSALQKLQSSGPGGQEELNLREQSDMGSERAQVTMEDVVLNLSLD